MKYLRVYISQDFNSLFTLNFDNLLNSIQEDITRWSSLTLDFSTRIEIVKINLFPDSYISLCLFPLKSQMFNSMPGTS